MSSSEIVSKMFDKNQNLVEDILEAAVATITNAHVQEKNRKFGDSEKSSPQSQSRFPAQVEVTP